jgi:exodeoxyribonuclease-3
MKLISWNVNGIRAIAKKGFVKWLLDYSPEVLCLQETKAHRNQLSDELLKVAGYEVYFESAEKSGYSGVAIYTKRRPLNVVSGMGVAKFDSEGRVLAADFGKFILFNVYFPNGKASKERLKYKMDFYAAFLKHVNALYEKGRKIIVCGDVNTAHTELDLARPKENEAVSGFLPSERLWMDEFIASGFVDAFRIFVKEGGHYSWWDYKTRARERNVGWRIDYFFVSKNFKSSVKNAFILSDVDGSDHCPIGIEIE